MSVALVDGARVLALVDVSRTGPPSRFVFDMRLTG